jgi:hypothetical protein
LIDKNINKLSVGWKNQKLRRQTKLFWFVNMIKQRHAGSRLYAIGRQMSGVSGIKLSIMSSWIETRTTTRKSNEHLIKTFFLHWIALLSIEKQDNGVYITTLTEILERALISTCNSIVLLENKTPKLHGRRTINIHRSSWAVDPTKWQHMWHTTGT